VVSFTRGGFTSGERVPSTHWIGGWLCPRAGLDDVEKRKILPLPGLKIRPLGRPVSSQSLYDCAIPAPIFFYSVPLKMFSKCPKYLKFSDTQLFLPLQHIVACTAVAMQRPRDKRIENGVMQPVSMQRIGKHFPAASNTHETIKLLLEMVFSTRSVQNSYLEDN
jgi:hypothetical protein